MIKFAKAIAANSDLSSAQAFVFLTANINLSLIISGEGDDCFTKIRQAVSDFESSFFEAEDEIPERINTNLELIYKTLTSLTNIQLLLGVWQENILYLRADGKHHAFLQRSEEITQLTNDEVVDQKGQLISGHLEKADKLLFLSNSLIAIFLEENKERQIEKLIKTSVDNFEEEIELFVPADHQINPIAATLIDYHTDLAEAEKLIQPISKEITSEPLNLGQTNKLTSFFNSNRASLNFNKGKFLPKKVLFGVILLGFLLLAAFIGSKFLNQKAENKNFENSQNNYEFISSPLPERVVNLESFLDLSLIKEGFRVNKLSLSLGSILLLDQDAKTLVMVELATKNSQILAGESQLGDAKSATLNGDFAFVYSQDKGIVRVDTKNKKITVVVKPDTEWGEIIDIYGFASNIYLLDKKNNQIWKYLPTELGYTEKRNYLSSGISINFDTAQRLEIDSSVWVQQRGNEILKFTQGVKDNFSPNGLSNNLSEVANFYTSDKTDNIYILDKGSAKIIVLDKTGKFMREYKGDRFQDLDDFIVDEQEKLVYLLIDNKIQTFVLD